MDLRRLVFTLCGMIMFAGLIGLAGPSSSVAQSQSASPVERTPGDIVGASISHPKKWFVKREASTYDGTFGFVLWDPKPGTVEDHGGTRPCASRGPRT